MMQHTKQGNRSAFGDTTSAAVLAGLTNEFVTENPEKRNISDRIMGEAMTKGTPIEELIARQPAPAQNTGTA